MWLWWLGAGSLSSVGFTETIGTVAAPLVARHRTARYRRRRLLPKAPGSGLGGLLLSSFVVSGVVTWRVMNRWLDATTADD
jgi:hypothetical protein